jgi:hypothetical protein
MRAFSFSELYGPFRCEHHGCKERTFVIVLSDAENEGLPESSGPKAAAMILSQKLGKATCDDHLRHEPREGK